MERALQVQPPLVRCQRLLATVLATTAVTAAAVLVGPVCHSQPRTQATAAGAGGAVMEADGPTTRETL